MFGGGTIAAGGLGLTASLMGNFAYDPTTGKISSSATFTAGGGAAAAAPYYAGGGFALTGSNARCVQQLNGTFINGGRAGLGPASVQGFVTPDQTVKGGGITVGVGTPTILGASAFVTETFDLGASLGLSSGNWW